jgi:hypothetical protein
MLPITSHKTATCVLSSAESQQVKETDARAADADL